MGKLLYFPRTERAEIEEMYDAASYLNMEKKHLEYEEKMWKEFFRLEAESIAKNFRSQFGIVKDD